MLNHLFPTMLRLCGFVSAAFNLFLEQVVFQKLVVSLK